VTRHRFGWLGAALVALVAAWALAPGLLPIYDAGFNTDEPYRFVQPPPGYTKTTKPPTSAQTTVPVRGGRSSTQYANSGETGPQVSLFLPAGALQPPPGAATIAVSARPLAPSPPLPADGHIITNVYRITATADGRSVPVIGTGPTEPALQMRAPSPPKGALPVFEHRTPTGWQHSQTIRIGQDIYQTSAASLGDWALVQLSNPAKSTTRGGGINTGLLAAGLAVLAVAGVILAVRLRRTRNVGT
jgi:hypothetical protein